MTTPLTPEQIAEIRKRAEAATPGPWTFVEQHGRDRIWLDVVAGEHENEVLNGETQPQPSIIHKNFAAHMEEEKSRIISDLEFAAHARSDIPALLDSHALLAKERDEAVAKLASARRCMECNGTESYLPKCCNGTGIQFSDDRARELLEQVEHMKGLLAASESLRQQLNKQSVKDAIKFNELLARLRKAEEDSALLQWAIDKGIVRFRHQSRGMMREELAAQMRDARAEESTKELK